MINEESAVLETGLKAVDGGNAKLTVLSAPVARPRPIANLAKVFGQFAEIQHQVAEQVMALEESLVDERQETAAALAVLPELKERINWLIASFYEQSQRTAGMEDRINRQNQELVVVKAEVKSMVEHQRQWQDTMDQLADTLIRARSARPAVARTSQGAEPADSAVVPA